MTLKKILSYSLPQFPPLQNIAPNQRPYPHPQHTGLLLELNVIWTREEPSWYQHLMVDVGTAGPIHRDCALFAPVGWLLAHFTGREGMAQSTSVTCHSHTSEWEKPDLKSLLDLISFWPYSFALPGPTVEAAAGQKAEPNCYLLLSILTNPSALEPGFVEFDT